MPPRLWSKINAKNLILKKFLKRRYFDKEEQIAFALKQAEGGTTAAEITRRLGINEKAAKRRIRKIFDRNGGCSSHGSKTAILFGTFIPCEPTYSFASDQKCVLGPSWKH